MTHRAIWTFSCCLGLALAMSACTRQPIGTKGQKITRIRCLSAGGISWHKLYASYIEDFERRHPDIQVVLIENVGQRNKLQVMMAGGTPPDVAVFSESNFIPYAGKGAFVDLGTLMDADVEFRRSDYYDNVMATGVFRGKQFGMPCYFSTIVLYYNKNAFRRAGIPFPDETWTWDTFLDAAQRLTVDADNDGRIDQYGFLMALGTHRWPIFIWQNGGQVVDDGSLRFALDTPAAVAGIQFYSDLVNRHHVAPAITEYGTMSIDSMFMTGRAAMTMQSRYQLSAYQHIKDFEWDVAVLPKGKERATAFISSVNCILKTTRHVDAAWEFVKFLSSMEAYRIGLKIMNSIPPLKQAAESELFMNPEIPPANDRAYIDMIQHGRVPNFERIAPELGEEYDRLYQAMDAVWLGQKSAAAVLPPAVARLNAAIASGGR